MPTCGEEMFNNKTCPIRFYNYSTQKKYGVFYIEIAGNENHKIKVNAIHVVCFHIFILSRT